VDFKLFTFPHFQNIMIKSQPLYTQG